MLESGVDMRGSTELLYFAACLLASGIWVAVAMYKLFHYQLMVEKIREKHIPLPTLAYWCSVAAELGGAVLVVTQWSVSGGVLIWITFLLIATPIFHGDVWRDGSINYPQFVHVFKNISIAGGLLALIALSLMHAPVVRPQAAPTTTHTAE